MTARLATLAWPDVAEVANRSLLAIPLGSTEQHGPHLPCTTDTDLAVALTEGLAARRADVIVAPPLSYGYGISPLDDVEYASWGYPIAPPGPQPRLFLR